MIALMLSGGLTVLNPTQALAQNGYYGDRHDQMERRFYRDNDRRREERREHEWREHERRERRWRENEWRERKRWMQHWNRDPYYYGPPAYYGYPY
jgi:hypothetical protein